VYQVGTNKGIMKKRSSSEVYYVTGGQFVHYFPDSNPLVVFKANNASGWIK